MVVDFARKNLVNKARSRPDLVRQVLDKAKREGIVPTVKAARDRLDQWLTLGYSCAGTVLEVADDVTDLSVGDRVACAGAGYACHAEVISVPRNLVAPVPPSVNLNDASFATLGAIALHGFRLAVPQLGESVAVLGLGILGLLVTQLARASGCRVLGMDPDPERSSRAAELGCHEVAGDAAATRALAQSMTGGHGFDAVIIAAATKSSEPVELAGEIARDRGRVVLIGAVGTTIPRKPYFTRELSFRVSRSYGPGRYDPEYEEGGHDYPVGFVRWTENRNLQAFLELLAEGGVNVHPLITHRFSISEAVEAYDLIDAGSRTPSLGVMIEYPESKDVVRKIELASPRPVKPHEPEAGPTRVALGVIGAGGFARHTLLPILRDLPQIDLVGVCSASGQSARHAGSRFGFRYCASGADELLQDPEINAVAILTRHHLHADQACNALLAGKHVFLEKPPALHRQELDRLLTAIRGLQDDGRQPVVMVGYNRRYAPLARKLREFLAPCQEPVSVLYRCNARHIPSDHWVQDPKQGGGRLIGEVCHFIDFMQLVTDSVPARVWATCSPNVGRYSDDNLTASIEFENGSIGSVTYVANGDPSFAKERVEVFCQGRVAVLEDFRRLTLVHEGRSRSHRLRRMDKGHRAAWQLFCGAVAGECDPPRMGDWVATSLTTFALRDALAGKGLQDLESPVDLIEKTASE
jgi:predicted dehydrogenase